MIEEKLDYLNIKGHVKISLFEDGKLVKQVEKDNFITKFGKEYLRILNAQNVGGGLGVSSDNLNWLSNRSATGTNTKTFEKLLLSDSDIPENPLEDEFLWGNNIGWADRTGAYSGTDTRRGSINLSESYTDSNRTHLVFDFPTHSANGIIKTLGFVNEGEGVEGVFRKFKDYDGNFVMHSSACKGRYAYSSSSSSSGNVRSLFKTNLDSLTIEEINLSNVIYGVANLNGNIYVSTGRDIFKLSQDEQAVTSEKLTLDVVFTNNVRIASLNNKLYLVTLDSTIDSVVQKPKREVLYIFNSDGTLDERVVMPISYSSIYSPLTPISKTVINVYNNVFDINTKEVASSVQFPRHIYDEELDKNYWLTANVINIIYPSSLATKVVLPSPITKTDTQTMKIEYDFTY